MKKSVIILILSITLLFCGCQSNADSETQKEEEAGLEVQEGQRENEAETGEGENREENELEEEAAAEEIALELSLKKVSATGATLVFNQYDKEAPTGELEFGADYTIERLESGEWEELPGPVEGSESENYVFIDVAYLIEPEAKREQEVDWEWLHGPLPPGEYRIKKTVHDFRGTGDFDEYTLYARFVLN